MDPLLLIPLSLAAIALLLMRWKRKRDEEEERSSWGGGGSMFDPYPSSRSGNQQSGDDGEAQRQRAAEQRQKEELVRSALNGDPAVAEQLGKQAGFEHLPMRGADDQHLVEEIARRLSKDALQIFNVAATQQEIRFDLQATTEREAVDYPTADMQPDFLRDPSDLIRISPDQLTQDAEQFYANLAAGELQVVQAYERLQRQQALEIVLDYSGSMDTLMQNGMSRHVWARGIAITQLMQAMRGAAKYLFLPFDGMPHTLQRATNQAEASAVIRNILNATTTGGGTDIPAALRQAITDINSLGGDLGKAAILLISDGEDSSIDASALKALLGSIQLHVVMIGSDNASLKSIATTYRKYE